MNIVARREILTDGPGNEEYENDSRGYPKGTVQVRIPVENIKKGSSRIE